MLYDNNSLSKAYDCLPHFLLFAKIGAYGSSVDSLTFMHSYLVRRKQRVKIGTSLSEWQEIKPGVPQGSGLGPFLASLFTNDFFNEIQHSQVCSSAGDNAIHAYWQNLDFAA